MFTRKRALLRALRFMPKLIVKAKPGSDSYNILFHLYKEGKLEKAWQISDSSLDVAFMISVDAMKAKEPAEKYDKNKVELLHRALFLMPDLIFTFEYQLGSDSNNTDVEIKNTKRILDALVFGNHDKDIIHLGRFVGDDGHIYYHLINKEYLSPRIKFK